MTSLGRRDYGSLTIFNANEAYSYYHQRSEESEGYVLTGVCYSFCPREVGCVTSNASWDRSHGYRGVSAWSDGGRGCLIRGAD